MGSARGRISNTLEAVAFTGAIGVEIGSIRTLKLGHTQRSEIRLVRMREVCILIIVE